VPVANINLGGSGTARTLTLAPAADAFGVTRITVTVSDGALSARTSFVLTVNSINDAPVVSVIPDQTTPLDQSVGPISFVVSDVESPASLLRVEAHSSNSALVSDLNLILGGTGANRTLSIVPSAGQF